MMKKIIFFLGMTATLVLGSCSDDDATFGTIISDDMFVFESVEGGSILKYTLSDPAINKVKVEYKDEFGSPIYKVGDFSVDTILLDGFHSAHTNVPVLVSFLDNEDRESEVKKMSFNTLPSNLYTFFDNAKVSSYWEGFQLTYELNGVVNGSATIYFVGENPNTHAKDTLTLDNFLLESGKYTKAYTLDASQQQSDYTVVVTTEDNKQRIIRQQVWTGVKGIERVMLPNADFELLDPFNKSKEEDYNPYNYYMPKAFGKKYLFDGDTKGMNGVEYYQVGIATPPFTFYTNADALHSDINDVYFVLDIKKPAMLGEMRFYARYIDGYAVNQDFGSQLGGYFTKLPCRIKVYAWIVDEPYDVNADQSTITADNWKLMGNVSQDPSEADNERWYYNADMNFYPKTRAELEALKPLYLSVPMEFDEHVYRYYKIEFEATYKDLLLPSYNNNLSDQVTCHEIEVYAKKQ